MVGAGGDRLACARCSYRRRDRLVLDRIPRSIRPLATPDAISPGEAQADGRPPTPAIRFPTPSTTGPGRRPSTGHRHHAKLASNNNGTKPRDGGSKGGRVHGGTAHRSIGRCRPMGENASGRPGSRVPPLVRGSPEGRRTAAFWPEGVTGQRAAAPCDKCRPRLPRMTDSVSKKGPAQRRGGSAGLRCTLQTGQFMPPIFVHIRPG